MINFNVAARTEKGIRKMNQDSLLAFKNKYKNVIVMVADGMGGHVGGQVASQFTIKVLREYFMDVNFDKLKDQDIQAKLENSINYLSSEFEELAKSKPSYSDMGTTLNLNVFVGKILYTLNIGDSRATKIDKNGLQQISEDHNLAYLAKIDKRFERFAANANLLTSSLGPNKETKIDIFKTKLKNSGYLIVTSDGIHQFVSENYLAETMLDSRIELDPKLVKIVEEAKRNHTNDNMTIIGVKYDL